MLYMSRESLERNMQNRSKQLLLGKVTGCSGRGGGRLGFFPRYPFILFEFVPFLYELLKISTNVKNNKNTNECRRKKAQ